MTFATPLWLLGLGTLLVPLVLHLLARGRGRHVAVGSVQLLTGGAARRPRRARLQRPLLLLVRWLLLAVVALALAGPRLRLPPRRRAIEPWVLVAPEVARERGASAARERPIDSALLPAGARRALATGGELRWLAPGLPPVTTSSAAASAPATSDVRGGVWSLLREADVTAPAGAPLVVVAAGRLADLAGERPTLRRPVDWNAVTDPHATFWSLARSDRSSSVLPRVRVAVHADPLRAADAARVEAALAAAADGVVAMTRVAVDEVPRLAFWLGDGEPTPALRGAIAAGGTLVRDAPPGAPCDTTAALFAAMEAVAWRRCPAPGRPPLDETPLGRGRVLRLAGRFDPATSDLVDSPAFPRWLRALLREAAAAAPTTRGDAADRRPDGGQGAPRVVTSARVTVPAEPSPLPELALWCLLPALLLLERWLGSRP